MRVLCLRAMCIPLLCSSAVVYATADLTETKSEHSAFGDEVTCNREPSDTSDTQKPLNIQADSVRITGENYTEYSGNVSVTQGKRQLRANKLELDKKNDRLIAREGVLFNDGELAVRAEEARAAISQHDIRLQNTSYQLLCESGRGEALYVFDHGQKIYLLEDSSITSCPEGKNTWALNAASIVIEPQSAVLYHPYVLIHGIPMLYFPYLSIPLNNKRKTGMLFPNLGRRDNERWFVKIPLYFNLAENYDLKTTFNFEEQRGIFFDNRARYLFSHGEDSKEEGSLLYEYLYNDPSYNRSQRWGVHFEHNGNNGNDWWYLINYAQVSDENFLSQLHSSIGNSSDTNLAQWADLGYDTLHLSAVVKLRQFQEFEEKSLTYQLRPQIKLHYFSEVKQNSLNYDVLTHVSKFESINHGAEQPSSAIRLHIEPGVKLPWNNPWVDVEGEARLLYTYYQQESSMSAASSQFERSVGRLLPEVRFDTRFYLERNPLVFKNYKQILEPRFQYLYVPEVDQEGIYPIYDTNPLQLNYHGLFSDRRYSSIDRISAENKITYGATSRYFDQFNRERFSFSLGQIYYVNQKDSAGFLSDLSSWAAETDANLSDFLFYHGSIQYDVSEDEVQVTSHTLEYKNEDIGLNYLQLSYRNVSEKYIKQYHTSDDKIKLEEIRQLGVQFDYELSHYIFVKGGSYFDLTARNYVENNMSFEYRSDCWLFSAGYTYTLEGWSEGGLGEQPIYEHGFDFTLGILGFGQEYKQRVRSAGNETILKYSRPFILN